jgi:hypothetical protein
MDHSIEIQISHLKCVIEIFAIPDFTEPENFMDNMNYLKGKLYKDRNKKDFSKVYMDTNKFFAEGTLVRYLMSYSTPESTKIIVTSMASTLNLKDSLLIDTMQKLWIRTIYPKSWIQSLCCSH